MKLHVTYSDATAAEIDVPDDNVEPLIDACRRGVGWGNQSLGIYIKGADVRSVRPAPARESDGQGGWVDR